MPRLELDASLDVDIGLDAALGAGFTVGLNNDLVDGIVKENAVTKAQDRASLTFFGNAALLPVGIGMNDAKNLTDAEQKPKPEAGLNLTESLELEPRVEVKVK